MDTKKSCLFVLVVLDQGRQGWYIEDIGDSGNGELVRAPREECLLYKRRQSCEKRSLTIDNIEFLPEMQFYVFNIPN